MNLKKTLAALVASFALCSGAALAGVIEFAITGTYTQGEGGDLPTTTIGLGGAGSFRLDPGASQLYFDFLEPGGGTFSTAPILVEGYYFLRSYAAGDTIGSGNFGDHDSLGDYDTILVRGQTAGAWTTSHAGYLGFRTGPGNFGWIEYDYTRDGSLSTITFLSGAYESVANLGIMTPAASEVPEPASIALLGLGMLGFGASRRKRVR